MHDIRIILLTFLDPSTAGRDDSRRGIFLFFLNTLEQIGKPIDMDVLDALYLQRKYVRPEDDSVQLRELRVVVEALLTGNAMPPEDEGIRELTELSSLYGMMLEKLLNSAVPSSADK